MPTVRRPRRGSMQFYPRKRAKRIFPRISKYPSVSDTKPLLFAGYKAGMTHAIIIDNKKGSPSFNQPISVPVTVFDSPPLYVIGVRGYSTPSDYVNPKPVIDVYHDSIPKDLIKKKGKKWEDLEKMELGDLRLIVATQPRKTSMAKKNPDVFEIGMGGSLEEKKNYAKEKIGKELKADEVFAEGDKIDVSSITKGKGFGGPVKRYGIKIRGRKDERARRKVGVHGAEGVGRILYTVPMAGQIGFHRRTEFNKQIIKITDEGFSPEGGFVKYGSVSKDAILVRGSVPGPKKRLVFLKAPMRAHRKGQAVEIKHVDTGSQQGR